MPRFKVVDYSPRLLPVDLSRQLLSGTFEFALHHLLEHEINLCELEARYCNDEVGASAYEPRILLKVVLLAYARGIVSSRGKRLSQNPEGYGRSSTCAVISILIIAAPQQERMVSSMWPST